MIVSDDKRKYETPVIPKLKHTEIANRDVSVLFWEATHKCDEKCPVYEECPYAGDSLKCDLCYRFLNNIKEATIQALGEKQVNEFQKHMLGTGVFSLWNQFLQFEIIRISLGMDELFAQTRSGAKVHPVFAEQRKVFDAIRKLYESVFGKENAVNFLDKTVDVNEFEKALRGE